MLYEFDESNVCEDDISFLETKFPSIVNNIPTKIQCVLYENNLIDNQLLHYIKSFANYSSSLNNNFITVPVKDLKIILKSEPFISELISYQSYSSDTISDYVSSLYFIDNIINSWPNLKWIVFYTSKERIYSRIQDDSLIFDYKILEGCINITDFTEDKDFSSRILYELDINFSFKENMSDSFNSNILLELFENLNIDEEKYKIFLRRLSYSLSNKFQIENPILNITH